jgi:hypothetical protein
VIVYRKGCKRVGVEADQNKRVGCRINSVPLGHSAVLH